MLIRFCCVMFTRLWWQLARPRGHKRPGGMAWCMSSSMLLLSGALLSNTAYGIATCSRGPSLTVSTPATVDIPANAVVGQVIGNTNGYSFDMVDAIRCTGYDDWIIRSSRYRLNGFDTGQFLSHSGLRMPIISSGIPGIGFALRAADTNGGYVAIGPFLNPPLHTTGNRLGVWGFKAVVYMVLTGPTTGGTYGGGFLGFFSLEASTGGSTHETRLPSIDFRAPRKPTCSVSTPSVRMSLGTVSTTAFRGVGSNAGSTTENISLSCGGGDGSTRDVLITVTDQTQPANRTDVLSLAGGSTADGVALQLLRGPTLIRYGADSSAIGNPNQWLAGSTGNGTFTIPLTARYIQTGSSITPGTANGVATFTMAYR